MNKQFVFIELTKITYTTVHKRTRGQETDSHTHHQNLLNKIFIKTGFWAAKMIYNVKTSFLSFNQFLQFYKYLLSILVLHFLKYLKTDTAVKECNKSKHLHKSAQVSKYNIKWYKLIFAPILLKFKGIKMVPLMQLLPFFYALSQT